MSDKARSVEDLNKKAIEDGEFEDLEEKGKLFELDNNPYVDDGWQTAFDLLSSQGLSLPWIDKRNYIEEEYSSAMYKLSKIKESLQQEKKSDEDQKLSKVAWEKEKVEFVEIVKGLNQVIDSYNLEIPNDRFYRKRIDVESEIGKI